MQWNDRFIDVLHSLPTMTARITRSTTRDLRLFRVLKCQFEEAWDLYGQIRNKLAIIEEREGDQFGDDPSRLWGWSGLVHKSYAVAGIMDKTRPKIKDLEESLIQRGIDQMAMGKIDWDSEMYTKQFIYFDDDLFEVDDELLEYLAPREDTDSTSESSLEEPPFTI